MNTVRLILLGCVLALAACATPNVDPAYRLDRASKEGVVALSISLRGAYSGYRVLYRRLDGDAKGMFELGSGTALLPPTWDFRDRESGRGNVYAAALPAGDYEIHQWAVSSGYAHVRSTEPFSIRFRVDPGKMVYLGNFHFMSTTRMGATVTGATVTYSDAAERDLPLLRSKFPGFADVEIGYAAAARTVLEELGGRPHTSITVPVFIPVIRR